MRFWGNGQATSGPSLSCMDHLLYGSLTWTAYSVVTPPQPLPSPDLARRGGEWPNIGFLNVFGSSFFILVFFERFGAASAKQISTDTLALAYSIMAKNMQSYLYESIVCCRTFWLIIVERRGLTWLWNYSFNIVIILLLIITILIKHYWPYLPINHETNIMIAQAEGRLKGGGRQEPRMPYGWALVQKMIYRLPRWWQDGVCMYDTYPDAECRIIGATDLAGILCYSIKKDNDDDNNNVPVHTNKFESSEREEHT